MACNILRALTNHSRSLCQTLAFKAAGDHGLLLFDWFVFCYFSADLSNVDKAFCFFTFQGNATCGTWLFLLAPNKWRVNSVLLAEPVSEAAAFNCCHTWNSHVAACSGFVQNICFVSQIQIQTTWIRFHFHFINNMGVRLFCNSCFKERETKTWDLLHTQNDRRSFRNIVIYSF